MAAQVLTTCQIGLGQYDVSADSAEVATSPLSVIVKDVPNFGSGGYTLKAAALREGGFTIKGWSNFATGGINANVTSATLGTQQLAYVAVPGTTAGDPATFLRGVVSDLNLVGGKVGEVSPFTVAVTQDAAEVVGWLAAPLAARTVTGNGTSVTQAGPTATQRVYAGLSITTVTGTTPTCVVKLQSAPLANFASPTDRITFTSANAAGWQWGTTALGAITDGFWRATWTIAGTTPSFTFAAVFGVAQ